MDIMRAKRVRAAPSTESPADSSPPIGDGRCPPPDPPILLSALPATPRHRRFALVSSLLLLAILIAAVPVAQLPLAPLPAFIVFQQTVLLANDLITAALLFAQYSVQPSRGLNVLAGGYLFTGLIVIPHALSFPGVISPTGLLGAGPQTTPWLYIAWRFVLPLTIMAYALRRDGRSGADAAARSGTRAGILTAVLAAIGGVLGLVAVTTLGHDRLPVLMDGNHFSAGAHIAVAVPMTLSLATVVIILRRRTLSILDLSLVVVMVAWFGADAIGSFVSGQRYDAGYYVGRVSSAFASTFVLLVLLYEMTALYARVMQAGRAERHESKRRLEEMTVVLAETERAERLMTTAKRVAEAASRTKTDFVGAVSHEIRTPMTCILGMAELLMASDLNARQYRQVALLRDAGQSLLAIVDDLLDMSKIEAGKLELLRLPLSLPTAAEGALAVLRPAAQTKGLDLQSELAPDLPAWIEGDPTRLRQVLLNLLSNAVKFTDRGLVILRIRRAADAAEPQLRFEVSDTGIGIDPSERHLLFQRFSQLGHPGARRRGGMGTGLGLAISRHVVEAMGGTIGVDSRIGDGSTFWFTIPCREIEEQVAPGPAEPGAEAGPGARILVAEDHEAIRTLIATMLSDAGHEVVLVANGAQAIAALETSDFDLVLMDVQMPGMDGIQATRRIREMGDRVRGIPIIALTAYATREDAERFLAAGANEHLPKPIRRAQLLRLVAKWSPPPAPPAGDGVAPPVIDAAVLDDLEERLGRTRATTFAGLFRDQVRNALDAVRSTTDRRRIAAEMHDLVSIAGTLGCPELTKRSRALLTAASQEDGDLSPLVAELTTAAGRALTAMRDRYPP